MGCQSETTTQKDRQARAWLQTFSEQVASASDVIASMPIDDLRAELHAAGMDGVRFHRTLHRMLQTAKLQHLAGQFAAWLSPVWQPLWAGQMVTAQDIPPQEYTFQLEEGQITIVCAWQSAQGTDPAFLRVSWEARLQVENELSARFIHPETQAIRREVCLGTAPAGEEFLTSADLGFDPSAEPWAIALMIKKIAS